MFDDLEASDRILAVYQGLLFIAGLFALGFLWRRLRARPEEALLKTLPWPLPLSDIILFILGLLLYSLLSGLAVLQLLEVILGMPEDNPWALIISGALLQAGMVVYFWAFWRHFRAAQDRLNAESSSWAQAGARALWLLLAAIPVLSLTQLTWVGLLHLLEPLVGPLPLEPQAPLLLFEQAESPWQVAALCLLAVVIAPVVEEIVFRGGLYRMLRGRFSPAPAMLLSGVVFSLLHFYLVGLPVLAVLAIILCLAYEWTGNLKTPILLHAFFNAQTVILTLLLQPLSPS